MAKVILTLKIMPEDPSFDLSKIEKKIEKAIEEFGGEYGKSDIEPIAFGLKCLKTVFILDESKGSTEELENELKELKEVGSVEVVDVRRAIG